MTAVSEVCGSCWRPREVRWHSWAGERGGTPVAGPLAWASLAVARREKVTGTASEVASAATVSTAEPADRPSPKRVAAIPALLPRALPRPPRALLALPRPTRALLALPLLTVKPSPTPVRK